MRALIELRDPFGIALAVATAATVFALQEGPLVAIAGGASVLVIRAGAGPLIDRWKPDVRRGVPPAAWHAPLSRREAEIAVLVSEGLTSREIADRLVLEKSTIDNHVFHIMNKLNVHNRTQIGVWVVERRARTARDGPTTT